MPLSQVSPSKYRGSKDTGLTISHTSYELLKIYNVMHELEVTDCVSRRLKKRIN
jgi:hypothetical protein